MDAPQHFRTALNGFRREDVVRYLEYLNAKHAAEINQYTAETDMLKKQLADLEVSSDESQELKDLRSQLEEVEASRNALQEKLEMLENTQAPANSKEEDSALKELQNENKVLRNQLQDLKAEAAEKEKAMEDRCAVLEAELKTCKSQETNVQPEKDLAEQELEAYRRAERAERVANEKADLIYHRTNSVLDEASGKIDGASLELSALAEKINAQLQQMQYSINSSKIALKSAVETMHGLRTDNK